MRRRRVFVVACILALALGAGYFLHSGAIAGHAAHPDSSPTVDTGGPTPQSTPEIDAATTAHKRSTHRVTSSAPLPPPGTPLKDIYDELAARARSGDRAASVRLFHDTLRCRYVDDLRQRYSFALPQRKRMAQSHKDGPDIETESLPGPSKDDMTWLGQTEPMCAGADPESSRSSPEWMRIAAQQGDAEAIGCYLNQDFINVPDALQHMQWLTDFQRDAPELAFKAVANGDWKAVFLLSMAYAGLGNGRWLSQTIAPDTEQAYRYAYLLELGGGITQKVVQGALEQQLTAEQIAAARTWANEVFATRFHGTPMYTGTLHPICPNPMALQN
jgi:hypothetical protein